MGRRCLPYGALELAKRMEPALVSGATGAGVGWWSSGVMEPTNVSYQVEQRQTNWLVEEWSRLWCGAMALARTMEQT